MSLEENEALIHRLVEAFNKHNVTLLDARVRRNNTENDA